MAGWMDGWLDGWLAEWLAGWMAGWMVLCNYNATLWLHLASWNLPDSQLS